MSFQYPYLLLLLPVTLLPALWADRRAWIPLALPPEWMEAHPSLRARLAWLPRGLLCLALAGALLAAAGPFRHAREVPDLRKARDICLALDISESMEAIDYEIRGRPTSRIEAARRFAERFVERRRGDRIGVVVFGSRATTQCPLTFDGRAARSLLQRAESGRLGKRTALGDGAALGVARLERGGALVLLSDGRDTAGQTTPVEAARAASSRGVRIYSVGIGTEGPAPMPVTLPSGRRRIEHKDYPLDEDTLREMAARTGGRYFRAAEADALRRAFAEIDRLEEHPVEITRTIPEGKLALWFGAGAAGLLLAALVLSATLFRTAPRLR